MAADSGYRYPNARLQIFARAPRAGASKTRLIPAMGPQGAAQLQGRFVRRTVAQAVAARLAPVELWCLPDCDHPLFRALAAAHPVALRAQQGSDLGARMAHALASALATAESALLIGTDCPAMGAPHWAACLDALAAGQDAALIPAEDGGYVAIGLRRPAPWLFEGIPWGGGEVAARARESLDARGWSWTEPAILWDVDEPGDWERLLREFPEFSRDAS